MRHRMPPEIFKQVGLTEEDMKRLEAKGKQYATDSHSYRTEDYLRGKIFKNTSRGDFSVLPALEAARNYAGESGIILTMPELIAAKAYASENHPLQEKGLCAYSEEDVGIDREGIFYDEGEQLLVVVHGGGLITPERIRKAFYHKDGLPGLWGERPAPYHPDSRCIRYTDEEFQSLLEGKLPDGKELNLYKIEEIVEGVPDMPRRFGVVMPYKTAQETKSGYFTTEEFMKNPLVMARTAGCPGYIVEMFADREANSDNEIWNLHPYNNKTNDSKTPHGSMLEFGMGLDTFFLQLGCSFVAVAPEKYDV